MPDLPSQIPIPFLLEALDVAAQRWNEKAQYYDATSDTRLAIAFGEKVRAARQCASLLVCQSEDGLPTITLQDTRGAHLISAAADMLVALKEIDSWRMQELDMMPPEIRGAWLRALAAIAKAEGL